MDKMRADASPAVLQAIIDGRLSLTEVVALTGLTESELRAGVDRSYDMLYGQTRKRASVYTSLPRDVSAGP